METFKFEAGGGGGGRHFGTKTRVSSGLPNCSSRTVENRLHRPNPGTYFWKGGGAFCLSTVPKKNLVEQWNIESRSFIQLWNLNGTKIDFWGFHVESAVKPETSGTGRNPRDANHGLFHFFLRNVKNPLEEGAPEEIIILTKMLLKIFFPKSKSSRKEMATSKWWRHLLILACQQTDNINLHAAGHKEAMSESN